MKAEELHPTLLAWLRSFIRLNCMRYTFGKAVDIESVTHVAGRPIEEVNRLVTEGREVEDIIYGGDLSLH